MSEHRAPATVHLLWCPECGRDDRWTYLKQGARRHYNAGALCPGVPQELTYKLPVAPEPAPPVGAHFRAAVAVEIAIRPGLAHLSGDRLTFVGRTVTFGADDVEQLADLSERILKDIALGIPDALAVHPRPAPHGWAEELLPRRDWRHEHRR